MIELCNETQKDMWINIPALATPAFVQSLAQLIDADLDPNLNVYIEYSNETWNTSSPCSAGAHRCPGQPPGDPERESIADGGAAERLRGGVGCANLPAGFWIR